MKEAYKRPETEVNEFAVVDVFTTSGDTNTTKAKQLGGEDDD